MIVAVSAILIGSTIVAVWVLLSNLRSEQIKESRRDLESLVLVLSEQIDRSFQSIQIVHDSIIDRINDSGILTPADLERQLAGFDTHQRFRDQIAGLPHIDALVLLGSEGRLINFSRSWPAPPIRRDNHYLQGHPVKTRSWDGAATQRDQ